jgi:RNA polymerase sigma-70 factor (ECF subfamily)
LFTFTEEIVKQKIRLMSSVEFNKQILAFSNQLRYFALSLTSNDEQAKDLLQETMLKAMVYRDKFADSTNLKAWLYTIMKNIFINNYRRAAKTRTIIDGTKDLYYVNLPQVSSGRVAESKMNEKEIYKAVELLEDEYKIPFEMYFEGYKYKEIAEHLDLPIGTVKSRIFLARKQLMDALVDL